MGDRVLRAMTDDGAFRMMVVQSTETVRGAIDAQQASGDAARILGDMVTSAILYRETMAPTLRVQAVIKGANGSGQIIADSYPDGRTRGLFQHKPDAPPFHLGQGSMLQMMRSLPKGELYQGVVELPKSGGVSEGLMSYMKSSEQIATVVRVTSVMNGASEVKAAGGFLVQLLPEAPDREGAIETMANRLEADFDDITDRLVGADASPDALLAEVFEGMPYTMLGDSAVHFGCDCSKVRVLTSLATLGVDELQKLLEDGEALDLGCDWCGTNYRVETEELKGLLTQS